MNEDTLRELRAAAQRIQIRRMQVKYRLRSLCRLAFIIDGVEGWAPWRPIADKPALEAWVADWLPKFRDVRAWVEVR